jgi:ATP-dependent Clp protease ATP-binding subunit ClpA
MEQVDSPWELVRDAMRERIIDQDPAIDAIVDALDASSVRSKLDTTPLATFAFLGPTGVGKSETAKSLAEVLREGNANLIKIDCSEYSNGHEVANLTGSPLGYVGSTSTPVINQHDIEKANTVVLFDEIEKGSPELYDLMLQIMGDGQLRVTGGEVVSFRDAIIIMSSNLGAKEMAAALSPVSLGFKRNGVSTNSEDLERIATREFDQFFRPEFINRIDKKVVFQPLDEAGLVRVLDVKLGGLNKEYTDDYGARLSLSDATKEYLVQEATKQPHMGARPLVRAFKDNVQTTFGRYVGSGAVAEGTHVKVFHASDAGEIDSDRLIFATEPDTTLRRKRTKEIVFMPAENNQEDMQEEHEHAEGEE